MKSGSVASSTSRERIVGSLQELYTVVVGLALVTGLTSLIDTESDVPIHFGGLPFFVAFLFTLVPFYHGALRHLDDRYISDPSPAPARALMADWALLFIEGCVLLALAVLVNKPVAFTLTFMVLLALDAIWGILAHYAFPMNRPSTGAELNWAILNLIAAGLLLIVLVGTWLPTDAIRPVGVWVWLPVCAIGVLRTIVDYKISWTFYYPPEDFAPGEAAA